MARGGGKKKKTWEGEILNKLGKTEKYVAQHVKPTRKKRGGPVSGEGRGEAPA